MASPPCSEACERNKGPILMLRSRDPASGIRDFEATDALAARQGLVLLRDKAMPANNRVLVWRRRPA